MKVQTNLNSARLYFKH